MNTDTPETDKAEYTVRLGIHKRKVVRPELARKLELERNQAIAKEQDATELCKRIIALAEKLEAERNQARQERDELRDAFDMAAEYIYEALIDYDSAFNRHRATEQGRKVIADDLEKVRSLLEKLKAKGVDQ